MSDPYASVLAVVTAFATASPTRDVAALEACLAPSAVQHVRFGAEWSPMPTATYLQLMRERKIGGEPVTVEVHGVAWFDGVATVHATRSTPSYRFEDVLTLTQTGDAWRIVGATVVVEPVSK
jgi:hypothetical protein